MCEHALHISKFPYELIPSKSTPSLPLFEHQLFLFFLEHTLWILLK